MRLEIPFDIEIAQYATLKPITDIAAIHTLAMDLTDIKRMLDHLSEVRRLR